MLSIAAATGQTKAQDISDHYTSSIQEEGTLYFVLPQKGFRAEETRNKLTYDLTHLSSQEQVTLNFTYTDQRALQPDSLLLIWGRDSIGSPTKKILVESKGKNWIYRYSAEFSFQDLEQFYSAGEPPKMLLYHKGPPISLAIKNRKWEKQSAIVAKILKLIEMNR